MATRPTVSEVEAGYNGNPVTNGELSSSGDFDNPDDAEELILEAERMLDNIFSDTVLFTAEIEGADDDFLRLLARHKWAIALGVEQSESQAGGSITYVQNLPAESRGLVRTPYGLEALEYLRGNEPNIGVVRTR